MHALASYTGQCASLSPPLKVPTEVAGIWSNPVALLKVGDKNAFKNAYSSVKV